MSARLPPRDGEWIDRTKPVAFRFEGANFTGYQGDVLSSALWAHGVRMLARSFKYHRPRGTQTFAGHDANVIVETDVQTNLRGDVLQIVEGLDARAVNTAGGLSRDRYRIIERFSRFLPVGFYYKAFHKPRWLFPFFERRMRQAAGLGRLNFAARRPPSPKDYDFCELLVIGGGPSGLSAAIAAATAGADVLLVDDGQRIGGSFCWQRLDQADELTSLRELADQLPNLRVRSATTAGGWYADQWVALFDDRRMTKLRAQATLIATGAIEQPAVFQNNDLPGVLLGSAAQRLLRLYAVKPCNRAVVLTANDDGYAAALDLADAGCEVAAVVDLRPAPATGPLARAVSQRGIETLCGHGVMEAKPNSQNTSIGSVGIGRLDCEGCFVNGAPRVIECDGLIVSVGWAPNSALASQAGVKFTHNESVGQLVPRVCPDGVFIAGRANGFHNLDDRIEDGRRAGCDAARYLGFAGDSVEPLERHGPPASHSYPIFQHKGKKNFVDFDEDIHLTDFVNAHSEGYDSVELMKRYSTYGMGPSQGKLSNANAVKVLARLNEKSIDHTGTTTARPFYQPVSIASLAGRRFHPHRHTATDKWHRRARAVMVHAGVWMRPEYYPVAGRDRDQCVLQEAQAVRQNAGLIDIGTLTKILVWGADAAALLERLFTGKFASQPAGSIRYALACDETGIVIEDAVVARLAGDHFYVSASTAGGEPFFREMQRWALLWGLDVTLVNVTGHWGAMNLAGPRSREILKPLTDVDLSAQSFPPGGVRRGSVCGTEALILRSAFLGELSFDIHLVRRGASPTWESLLRDGKSTEVRPIGTEAQRLLRLEKGHLIVGHDTDALTTPFEAGMDRVVKMSKPFFVGKRSLEILRRRPLERRLVGVAFPMGYGGPWPEECQLAMRDGQMVGRVTSIARVSTLGHGIAMAFVPPELSAPGAPLQFHVARGRIAEARVAAMPFYDPENARQTL